MQSASSVAHFIGASQQFLQIVEKQMNLYYKLLSMRLILEGNENLYVILQDVKKTDPTC